MKNSTAPRGHVHSVSEKRILKARKVEHLLGLHLAGIDLLDLGAGSGFLAAYFKSRGARVVAADRDTSAIVPTDLAVKQLDGNRLPFEDCSFDVIVFNHVIEHVGDRPVQEGMIAEIARCLRPGGQLYLAVPNKWAFIEPHYRIPLLGALPREFASILASRLRGAPDYDCFPFSRRELYRMVKRHFSNVDDVSFDAFRWTAEHEVSRAARLLLINIPDALTRLFQVTFPTLVIIAQKL